LLSFKGIELSDKPVVDACLKNLEYHITESSFVDLFIWKDKYICQIATEDEFLFVRFRMEDEWLYVPPMGTGDFSAAIQKLDRHCEDSGEVLEMCYLTESMAEAVEAEFPGRFEIIPDRDAADYLYLAEKMITLAGKKLHSKRNFVNRFKAACEGRWSFETFNCDHLAEIRAYEKRWKRDNRTSEGDLEAENVAINLLLDNMAELGSVGGILRLDGEIIGFSIGTPISKDTMGIQIEKADWEIPGAYQVLANEFAKQFCGGCTYINREDDMGLEGLRQAKLSYYPEQIIMKYVASDKCAGRMGAGCLKCCAGSMI